MLSDSHSVNRRRPLANTPCTHDSQWMPRRDVLRSMQPVSSGRVRQAAFNRALAASLDVTYRLNLHTLHSRVAVSFLVFRNLELSALTGFELPVCLANGMARV